MTKRHSYHIRIDVEHFSKAEAVKKFEELYLKLKLGDWREECQATSGAYPFAKTSVEIGPIPPSVLDRLARLEREFDSRLGGLSEDAA